MIDLRQLERMAGFFNLYFEYLLTDVLYAAECPMCSKRSFSNVIDANFTAWKFLIDVPIKLCAPPCEWFRLVMGDPKCQDCA